MSSGRLYKKSKKIFGGLKNPPYICIKQNEMTASVHTTERIDQRLEALTNVDVKVESTTANYTKVGTISISDSFKQQVKNKLEAISALKTSSRKSYAFMLGQLQMSLTKFNSEADKQSSKGKQLVASVHNSRGESQGTMYYAIVRDGVITTTCLVKPYTSVGNGIADKLRVDAVIKNIKKFRG